MQTCVCPWSGLTFAQAAPGLTSHRETVPLLTAIGVLIVVVLAAGLILVKLKKRASASQHIEVGLLDSLRRLHREGKLSEAEFSALKHKAVERTLTSVPSRQTPSKQTPLNQTPSRQAATSARKVRVLPRDSTGQNNDRVAPQGFDLTGEPLPRSDSPE